MAASSVGYGRYDVLDAAVLGCLVLAVLFAAQPWAHDEPECNDFTCPPGQGVVRTIHGPTGVVVLLGALLLVPWPALRRTLLAAAILYVRWVSSLWPISTLFRKVLDHDENTIRHFDTTMAVGAALSILGVCVALAQWMWRAKRKPTDGQTPGGTPEKT